MNEPEAPNQSDELVAERGRSVVTRRDGVIVKRYRRPDPRNEIERAAYEHLRSFPDAPVPRLLSATADAIELEDIEPVGDFERALQTGTGIPAARELGRAYAALHDIPPPVRGTPAPCDPGVLTRWCAAIGVPEPDLSWAYAAFDDPGAMLAFSHGDPAPSNALVRLDGTIVLVDFEYADGRHRGYDVAAWYVLCPLEPTLLDAFHEGYEREIEGLDALIVWRTVQVVGMNQVELLDADREFAPGWPARASLLTALRRGGTYEPGFLPLHDALASRWPESAEKLPRWD